VVRLAAALAEVGDRDVGGLLRGLVQLARGSFGYNAAAADSTLRAAARRKT
jgi:hypothetical protein